MRNSTTSRLAELECHRDLIVLNAKDMHFDAVELVVIWLGKHGYDAIVLS